MGDDAMKISLLTIGDSQVGKSSLLLRFASETGKFNPTSMPTIGIDFKMKNLDIDGKRIKCQIVSCCLNVLIQMMHHVLTYAYSLSILLLSSTIM
jgi:hypothetical protein